MKKSTLTENKAEQTPTGGVLVGKREGQTIIHNKGTLSGYLVGKTHAEGGIKAVNKSTGQPLEMQGGEVVITAPAVSDNTKREFEGKMMTNREILSTINEKGGGVSFAKGGDVPKDIKRTGASYKYGGKTMTDHEIYKYITGGHLAEGMTLTKIAKMHKVSVKELQKQVDLGMKAESEHTSSKREQMKIVKDHLFENPEYYTLLKKAGLEDGGSTLLAPNGKPSNLNAEQYKLVRTPAFKKWFGDWEKDKKNASKVIDSNGEPLVVYHGTNAKFTIFDTDEESKNRKGGTWDADYPDGYIFMISDIKKAKYYGKNIIALFVNMKYPTIKKVKKGESLVLPFDDEGLAYEGDAIVTDGFEYLIGTQDEYLVKLADGKNTTFNSKNPDIRFNHGGRVHKDSLVKDAKSGNTPARDLNNYNDVLDLDADGVVGAETGLFARGGKVKPYDANMEGDSASVTYDDGGSVKELVEYITIGNQSSNPFMDIEKVRFYNFNDFKDFVNGLYKTTGATNKRELFICINNDDSTAKISTSISKGKNTNSNFNPSTGTFQDLEKNFKKHYPSSFDSFDWDKWSGVKTSKTTPSKTSVPITPDADSVIAIMIYNQDKVFIEGADTVYKLLDILIKAQEEGINKFYRKYIFEDSSIYQADYVGWIESNPSVYADINPLNTSPTELKEWLRKQKDLHNEPFNLDYFFSKSASATPTANTLTEIPDSDSSFSGIIKELPEPIKMLALQRQVDAGNTSNDDLLIGNDSKGGNFDWDATPEKDGFWQSINIGNFEPFKKIYGNYGEGLTGVNIATPTSTIKPILVSALTLDDLSDSKVWLGNNPELSERIQNRAFQLGLSWVDGDKRVSELDAPCLIFNGAGNSTNRIEKRVSKSLFDNVNLKEIFITDLITISTPTSAPIDLTETKIWIGNNPALSKKIQERAFQLGFDWWGGDKNVSNLDFDNLFFDINQKITSASGKANFDSFKDYREITEADLFPTSTASQTSNQNVSVEEEDWVKKFTADLDKLVTYLPNDMDFAPQLSKEKKDLENLKKLLPSFQQKKYAIERAKILKEIKRLHNKLTYEGFIQPNEEGSTGADLFTPQGLLDYYYTQATQNPTADLDPPCELPTPNGEKSKLPMSAYLNVRTQQFKNWFGDWEKAYETGNYVNCSKMIDPDTKEPKIYFHGVRKFVPNFGQFSNMGQGVVRPYGAFEPPTFPASYFAGEEDYAKFYGGVAENMPTPSADYKPFIYKVFLSVKNPISLLPLDFMLSYKDFMDYIYVGYGVKVTPNQQLLTLLQNDLTKKNPMWIYIRRDIGLIELFKDYGYDAIFQMGDIPTFLPNGEVEPDRTKHLQEVEYLTFYPSQVKSATVKKSFYFDFFNDIRFKNGGYVRI